MSQLSRVYQPFAPLAGSSGSKLIFLLKLVLESNWIDSNPFSSLLISVGLNLELKLKRNEA